MEIKLIRSGGLTGKKMVSKAEWKYSDKEWDELIKAVERTPDNKASKKSKDATYHALQKGDAENTMKPISVQNIPEKYIPLFKELFENLKAAD